MLEEYKTHEPDQAPDENDLRAIEAELEDQDDQDDLSDPVLSDPVKAYLREIGSIPMMTPEEEHETAVKAINGDEAAAAKMVEANLRLVVSVAKRYRRVPMEFLDIIQNGNMGLMKAVTQFNPDLGFKFSTYATWWIRQSITRGIADQSRLIRIPVHTADFMGRILKASNTLLTAGVENPTPAEISELTQIPASKVKDLLQTVDQPLSIDALIGEDTDTSLSAMLSDGMDTPQEMLDKRDMRDAIQKLLEVLPDRERYILSARFGLNGQPKRTLEDLASELNITRERVRQLEAKAFRRIRNPRYSRALIPYLEDCD